MQVFKIVYHNVIYTKGRIVEFVNFMLKQIVNIADMAEDGFRFVCDDVTLKIISQYQYLRLILTKHLDYLQITKFVAKLASHALRFLICKVKALGGMPFKCFTKCYNSLVQPVIDYGSSIWGTNGYSCVEVVQNALVVTS